ncbi:MAG: hypothetical protein IPO41_13130 [Acidobacteria bacterium]|nr:hypothetical protein [Acidobacteriota bacterium]
MLLESNILRSDLMLLPVRRQSDLQYLASQSGGRYYNAADRGQLIRALRKQVRRTRLRVARRPIRIFATGLAAFSDSNYLVAAASFSRFIAAYPSDGCGLFDLALAYEASDRYKAAAENYQKYLATGLVGPERAKTLAKITEMNEEYANQFDYYIRLLRAMVSISTSFTIPYGIERALISVLSSLDLFMKNALFMLIFPTFSK